MEESKKNQAESENQNIRSPSVCGSKIHFHFKFRLESLGAGIGSTDARREATNRRHVANLEVLS